jgi:anti-sigma factor (TIGR02949 family)
MTKHDIDCEQALKSLFDFLDHELDDAERDAMQRHLSTCRSCWSRANFEQRLKDRLRELRRDEPAQDATARIKRLLESF